MLDEHLSQEHGRASRQLARIDRQVAWIHGSVFGGRPGQLLDLGCGPGLYTTRLAELGHSCVGIDFAPASIAYAEAQAKQQRLSCEYRLQDLRHGNFGSGFSVAILVFGELNAFSPPEARSLLVAAHEALAPYGVLVLEVHTEAYVRRVGEQAPSWFSADRGLFSDRPHLCLRECTWHATSRAAVERYYVIDLETAEGETHTSTTQAYSQGEYGTLLRGAGFPYREQHPSLAGETIAPDSADLFVIVARKAAA